MNATPACVPRRARKPVSGGVGPSARHADRGFLGKEAAGAVTSGPGARWLGREDSNLRMREPKSRALPLGHAPPTNGVSVSDRTRRATGVKAAGPENCVEGKAARRIR